MALIVEDGTVVALADSYISEADGVTYVTEFYGPDDGWFDFSVAEHEVFQRRACYYMDNAFQARFLGARYDANHTRAWPRTGVYNNFDHQILANSEFPGEDLGRAQMEIARKLSQDVDFEPDAIRLASKEKVGPIEVTYDNGQPGTIVLRNVETMLARWLGSSGYSARIARG